jgi:putative hydrolase of the HAD superfamily
MEGLQSCSLFRCLLDNLGGAMKKYLLWDFDNTLAYRDGMWSQTMYELLREYGYKNISMDDIRPRLSEGFPWHTPEASHEQLFNGMSWWDYMTRHISRVIQALGVEGPLSYMIAGRFRNRYLDITKWRLYEDTIPCLKKATEKGYDNIIVSNHVPELADLVKGLGIENYFSRIYSSADVGYEKPNIEIYRRVIKSLDSSHDVTMIGDSYVADVEGAVNAGIKAILVRKENPTSYPYYCKDLNDIFNVLY